MTKIILSEKYFIDSVSKIIHLCQSKPLARLTAKERKNIAEQMILDGMNSRNIERLRNVAIFFK